MVLVVINGSGDDVEYDKMNDGNDRGMTVDVMKTMLHVCTTLHFITMDRHSVRQGRVDNRKQAPPKMSTKTKTASRKSTTRNYLNETTEESSSAS